jgi:NADH-quinone oxidoreductase subunit F
MPTERNPPHAVADDERATVDRALARLGADPRRSDLLPLLHEIQASLGWLPKGALELLADKMRLSFPDVWGVATFYALFRLEPPRGPAVHVCDDVPCRLRGADSLLQALEARYGPARRFTGEAHGAQAAGRACAVEWETVPCLGQCDHAPVAAVAGRLHRHATVEEIAAAAKGSAGA